MNWKTTVVDLIVYELVSKHENKDTYEQNLLMFLDVPKCEIN